MHTDPYLKEAADGEVLVRVDGVRKKFCRSLKKSLWYGVCDIASELNPFGRVERMTCAYKYLTTKDTESTEVEAKCAWRAKLALSFQVPPQAGLHGVLKTHRSFAQRITFAVREIKQVHILHLRKLVKSVEKKWLMGGTARAFGQANSGRLKMSASNSAGGNAWG
jgi:hypothetical protein